MSLLGEDADKVYAKLGAPDHTSRDQYRQGYGLRDRDEFVIVHLYELYPWRPQSFEYAL